ncbi:RNA-directed DNA polymerase, eukaryota [Tanacetum coccineum]
MAGRARSNADYTRLISKSIFVTNFPDDTTSKVLWSVCQTYGTVVDVYIPNCKSKAGKRFAFVRFIKVDNVDRLVGNLCTLWIGRMHLHANVVRFERASLQPSLSAPAMVLDDTCVVKRDLDNFVMGEVKQFSSIVNLRVLLSNEGFHNVKITYLGGLWVMFELDSLNTKAKFLKHVGVASWFSRLCNAQHDFVSKERIVWVDIKGVPFHAWSRSTFYKIGSKWGEVMEIEECKDDLLARIVWSPEFKDAKDAVYCSDDESDKGDVGNRVMEDMASIDAQTPPDGRIFRQEQKKGGSILEVLDDMIKVGQTMGFTMEGLGSKAKKLWIRELNIKHKVSFLSIQETKTDSITAMEAKVLWGNSNFEHIFSEAIGNSGGILCMWDLNVFLKDQHIISDNFVALYGTWIPNKTKLLIVSVYAPQSVSDKRSLWSFITGLIS